MFEQSLPDCEEVMASDELTERSSEDGRLRKAEVYTYLLISIRVCRRGVLISEPIQNRNIFPSRKFGAELRVQISYIGLQHT
jgi:hypothetical protein